MAYCLYCKEEFTPHRQSFGLYCSNRCQQDYAYTQWVADVEAKGVFPTTQAATPRKRRYLIEKQGGKCAVCGRKTWMNQPIPLTFDHINGLHTDWRLENCRMICNNCDALQPTYKGRNKGRGRKYRKKYYKPA